MKRCATCSWHGPKVGGDYPAYKTNGSLCLSPHFQESCYSEDDYGRSNAVYPYYEGAEHLWTGDDFGCVHHKEAAA